MVQKEKHLRYISKLNVNRNPQKLGADATRVISASGAHSKIDLTNMSVAPQLREGFIYHR